LRFPGFQPRNTFHDVSQSPAAVLIGLILFDKFGKKRHGCPGFLQSRLQFLDLLFQFRFPFFKPSFLFFQGGHLIFYVL